MSTTSLDASRTARPSSPCYRDVVERSADAPIIGDWIAEVEMERRSLERQLGRKPTERPLTQAEVSTLVARLKDIVAVLKTADPELKRSVYDELGVRLTDHPDGQVHVEAGQPHVPGVRVGGASSSRSTRAPWHGQYGIT